jgi:hypothetical protein
LAGGEVLAGVVEAGALAGGRATIDLRAARVEEVLGVPVAIITELKQAGIVVMCMAGNVRHAVKAAEAMERLCGADDLHRRQQLLTEMRDVEHAADLACLNHLAVQAIEGLGLLGEALAERVAAFHVLAHLAEDGLHLARLLLLLQDLKRSQQRQG